MGQTRHSPGGTQPHARRGSAWPGGWKEPVRSADWVARFPWLAQGTTGRGPDLRVFGRERGRAPWAHVAESHDFDDLVLTRQVHGTRVLVHGPVRRDGIDPRVAHDNPEEADGHVTSEPGLLLAVTVADCVPVFLADPVTRSVGVVHAGWRGAAAGILERALAGMATRFDADPGNMFLHLGPAICGACYEVGPEVHQALGLPVPEGPAPVDVRAELEQRARRCGVPAQQITQDPSCSLEDTGYYSHRGGDAGRQAGFIGIRTPKAPGHRGRP